MSRKNETELPLGLVLTCTRGAWVVLSISDSGRATQLNPDLQTQAQALNWLYGETVELQGAVSDILGPGVANPTYGQSKNCLK